MSKGVKILIFSIIAVLYVVVRVSFLPLELNERAIILGIGIDYEEETQNFVLSAEIATPKQNAMGSESSASQGSQKIVEGKGQSVGLAIRDLFNSFGKTPSFGECGIVMLGETCAKQVSLKNTLDYFVRSGAFRDGTIVVVSEGPAKKMLQKKSQVDEYVSFALQTLLVQSGHKAQIQYTTLNTTAQGFFDKSKSCYLNLIKFEKQNSNESEGVQGENSNQGKFKTGQMALFSDGKYVGSLDRNQLDGLNLYGDKNIFCTFVDHTNPQKSALALDKKDGKTEISVKGEKVNVKVDLTLGLKLLLTDTVGEVFPLRVKEGEKLSELQKQGASKDAKKAITSAFEKCVETDCDFLGIKNALYAKYGKKYNDLIEKSGKDFWSKVNFDVVVNCNG